MAGGLLGYSETRKSEDMVEKVYWKQRFTRILYKTTLSPDYSIELSSQKIQAKTNTEKDKLTGRENKLSKVWSTKIRWLFWRGHHEVPREQISGY